MRRAVLLALSLLLVASGLSSCGLFGGGDDDDLQQALGMVPSDATTLEFVDRAAVADRLGLGDVHTGASGQDVDRYQQAVASAPVSGTDLFLPSLALMQDAPFSELDVDWSITGTVAGQTFSLFRMDDAADLDAVGDQLAASGFTEDTVDGRRHLTGVAARVTDLATGLVAGHYPPSFLDVTLDPDHHLLLVGGADQTDQAVLAAVDGDHDSLADAGTLDTVLPQTDGVELAVLDPAPRCGSRIGNLSAEQTAQVRQQSARLGTPTATSFVVREDGSGSGSGSGTRARTTETARLQFASPDAATADAAARTTYLVKGRLVVSGQPVVQLGTGQVSASDDLVVVDVHYVQPARASELAERGDGFLLCHAP